MKQKKEAELKVSGKLVPFEQDQENHQIWRRLGFLRRPIARRRTAKMKQKKKPWMLLMKEVKILVSPLEMSSTNVCTCPSRLKNDQV